MKPCEKLRRKNHCLAELLTTHLKCDPDYTHFYYTFCKMSKDKKVENHWFHLTSNKSCQLELKYKVASNEKYKYLEIKLKYSTWGNVFSYFLPLLTLCYFDWQLQKSPQMSTSAAVSLLDISIHGLLGPEQKLKGTLCIWKNHLMTGCICQEVKKPFYTLL